MNRLERINRSEALSRTEGLSIASVAAAGLLGALWGPAWADENPIQVPGLNPTEQRMADVIFTACARGAGLDDPDFKGKNDPAFQDRCNAVVGAGVDQNTGEVETSLRVVSPEQISAPGTEATKISGGQMSSVGGTLIERLVLVHAGGAGASGLQFAINGTPVGGAAGGDETSGFGRWGTFVNVVYNTGDVDKTFRQRASFDFDIWGFTAGADYRFNDAVILGAAFSYFKSDVDFDNNRGDTDSNSYNGSVYSNWYVTDRFYLDGVATYGSLDYDINRKIRYDISDNIFAQQGDIVRAEAKADSVDGYQLGFNFGAGYDYAFGAWSLTPYARGAYTKLHVDSYNEKGGDGWAMHFSRQNVSSLRSILGGRAGYAFKTSHGVFSPEVFAEWNHEFKDDDQSISTQFLGDNTSGESFQVITDNPDRDYFRLGGGVSATFAHGFSAFADYQALVGYDDVTSHQFMLGGRMEF